ncbi:hypothetical protein ASG57_34740 [Bradyrhizobium sp. Leaf396]|nr:hypothetical protein ASG57_34740 [Bradyrhizobium sp. Leaf396]
MPRYCLNVTHEHTEVDRIGEELPDKHAAWKEATVVAGQTLQGIDGKLVPGRNGGWRSDEFQNTPFILHINAEKPD